MIRKIVGVAAGLVAWFVVATIANMFVRVSLPGYFEAEKALNFTLGMLLARLAVGALASVCAGFTIAWIIKSRGKAIAILGIVLTVIFIPVHYGLWDKFPVWYHLTFLVSLLPLTLLGSHMQHLAREPQSQ